MPACFASRLACPRFRMPLSHAAWRFRTRTHHRHHHASRPHHASRQSQSHSAHSHSHSHSHSHAHSTIIPTLTSALTSAPLSTRLHQPPLRCFCLLADRFASSESTNSQPQAFSTQRNAAHHHQHTPPPHATLPLTCHPPSVLHCTDATACHRRVTQAPCCANTVQAAVLNPAFSLHCTVS